MNYRYYRVALNRTLDNTVKYSKNNKIHGPIYANLKTIKLFTIELYYCEIGWLLVSLVVSSLRSCKIVRFFQKIAKLAALVGAHGNTGWGTFVLFTQKKARLALRV